LPVNRLTRPNRPDPAKKGRDLRFDELGARPLWRDRGRILRDTCARAVHAVLALPRSSPTVATRARTVTMTSASRIMRARSTA
jgi:hypothetical protein